MRHTRPGVSEDLLASRMEWECRKRGAKGLSYVPVVAGGRNALTMHYVQNQQRLWYGPIIPDRFPHPLDTDSSTIPSLSLVMVTLFSWTQAAPTQDTVVM